MLMQLSATDLREIEKFFIKRVVEGNCKTNIFGRQGAFHIKVQYFLSSCRRVNKNLPRHIFNYSN